MLGVTSNRELDTCHVKLQKLIREVDQRLSKRKVMDLTVTCGHRGEREQQQAFTERRSTKQWPYSRHNTLPSTAVDIAPYPVDWGDRAAFARLAGYVMAVADELDIEIKWGGDWDADGKSSDETFVDMPHFELTARELNRP